MKNTTPKYVTEVTFKQAMGNVGNEFQKVRQEMHHGFESLGAMINRLEVSSVRHGVDIKELKETVMVIRDDGQRVMQIVQHIASKYDEADRGRQIHLNQLMDFRPRIDDHEKRLGTLENQVQIKDQ